MGIGGSNPPAPLPYLGTSGKTNIGSSLQTYKVWIQESELWIGSFNPATQASRAHRAERSCDTTWKSFYSQCSVFAKLTEKLRHFRVFETKGGFAKVGNLTVARKNKPRLSHCQQPGTFCSPILVSVTRGAKVATSPGPWGRKSMRLMGG